MTTHPTPIEHVADLIPDRCRFHGGTTTVLDVGGDTPRHGTIDLAIVNRTGKYAGRHVAWVTIKQRQHDHVVAVTVTAGGETTTVEWSMANHTPDRDVTDAVDAVLRVVPR